MKTIVQESLAHFQQKILSLFHSTSPVTIQQAETKLLSAAKAFSLEVLKAYVEELSESLRSDRAGRREEGLALERRGDKRIILTQLGEFTYYRDYYLDHHKKQYRYPVDEILGVDQYQRVSSGISLALAGAAAEMSYGQSSRYVTEGVVSRQTVMSKVRSSQPKARVIEKKKRVAVLHVDADEDHVTLTGGQKSIVPLISVYEGIGQEGKKRYCKEVFHISAYGLEPDSLWEKALSEIENRYDLEKTAIYLHGDGAKWIKSGMEWLPNCRFVLDKYHKNKEIKKMSAGLRTLQMRREVETGIRESLIREDDVFFEDITESLCKEMPGREKAIRDAARYLQNHKGGIRICVQDKEANNGGCSEPHVSHVLSSRLSDRPRTWSKETLASLAPILAARGELEEKKEIPITKDSLLKKAAVKAGKAFDRKHTLGLVQPEAIGALTAIAMGKMTPTFQAVYSFSR